MEWVDGETLNNVLAARAKEPALDRRIAAQIIAHVASGLHAAHELRDERGAPLQLVHRDVSPQNILISRSGHVKVTDFGVAKSLGCVREATAIGKVKGKLSYMSPEQAEGKIIDRRSDIFSLGVVLYLATVGSHPFRRPGESRHQQMARLVSGRVKLPSEVVKGYPKQLEAILMRALSRNPAQRHGTADELSRRLQDWVVATGPLVTDQQIAHMVLHRAGPAILERSERIANLLWTPIQTTRSADDAVPSPADPTLAPTTSRSGSISPERARARATLRVVSTTVTAAALGLAASFVFSTPPQLPRDAFPVAAVSAAALPAAAVFAAAPVPARTIEPAAVRSLAPTAREAQATTNAPPLPAVPSVPPPAKVNDAPAASPAPSPATALQAARAPAGATKASAKPRSTKARKAPPPKRKRPRRVNDSFSIKIGR
jgi:serine/threonine-protein kinase